MTQQRPKEKLLSAAEDGNPPLREPIPHVRSRMLFIHPLDDLSPTFPADSSRSPEPPGAGGEGASACPAGAEAAASTAPPKGTPPAARSALASSAMVAPVVSTSSTKRQPRPATSG